MISYSLTDEISTLTTIPELNLIDLSKLTEDVIADTISTKNHNEDIISYNVGYGILKIQWNGDNIRFNFEPNSRFVKKIKNALKGESKLQETLEKKINQTLIRTYKDLL